MNKEIKDLLETEIKSQIESLSDIQQGTDEFKTSVDSVVKLLNVSIEAEQKESQMELEQRKQAHDYLIKNGDLLLRENIADNEKKQQKVKTCVEVGGIVAPLVVTIWGSLKAFEFEKTGTVTTMIGKGFINKLLPRK